ncbi:MAG TPA: hypothetical protein VFE98_02135 [Candidatus Bathyarchaeia archaeon]|nr:hypothetical protein [Candidatus Bathyarchaeia archaeon]
MPITVDDIVLSLIAGLIGLALTLPVTYLVVERIIGKNEKKRLAPVEKLARERIKSKLGVGFLTTFLITLVIDVKTAIEERRPIPKEVLSLHIERLKGAQSDLEMLLGVYNHVLKVDTTHLTSRIILDIEHMQEDFEYLAEIHPKGPTTSHAAHIEDLILKTVKETKEELETLGTENTQIQALEEWLIGYTKKRKMGVESRSEPILVKGGHEV